MRRHKNLYSQIVSFQNLLLASKLAQRNKRFRFATARFNFFLEKEICDLQKQLMERSYEPGKYHHFLIYEPKKRVISAAPYRDRVVHHAIHNVLEPIFDPTFISDSYATRKGKGTHAALDRFQDFARKAKYALKCDIRQYFPSIDHGVLLKLIERKVGCKDTLWLIEKILSSQREYGNGANFASIHPSIHPSRQIGIPIGNLTSQFFANVYLNGLDHFIKEKLGCRYYLRYMDDFVILHDDKNFLWMAKKEIQAYLDEIYLQLHQNKCRIFSTEQGVPFLGMTISAERRRLKRQNVLRFKRRMRRYQQLYGYDKIDWRRIHQSIQAWIGHAKHADSYRLRELLFEEIVFKRFDQGD